MLVGASILGRAPVAVFGGSIPIDAMLISTDGIALGNGLSTAAGPFVFNGSTWDRLRGNSSVGALVNTGASSVILAGTPNVNVAGSVASFPQGTIITSLVSTIPSSVIVGTSIFGQLPAGTAPLGSVATLQGTNPWIVAVQAQSIVGTYSEDAGHTAGDKGIFGLGVRNDTLASITSADSDYSAHAVGPSGETIVSITPFTKGIQGTGDLRVVLGASVTVIAAQGASVFSYIRSAQLANMGSASVLVTFGGGLGSILGYSIAPAGGGSNINFDPWLKTGANSAFTASINGTASVLVSAQGFIAKE